MLERLPDDAGWMCTAKLGRGSRWLWGVSHGHSTRALGQWGEWIELRHLLRLRWDVLVRNWKGRTGEVDLIAYDGPWLVLVEVKTRRVPSRLPTRGERRLQKEKEAGATGLRIHESPCALRGRDTIRCDQGGDPRSITLLSRHYIR